MTKSTKLSDIKRTWHQVDMSGKTLGRTSTAIAGLLMGKGKPYFVKNLDCGDYVIVVNAKEVKVTGNKETKKTYYRHSGYPGGLRAETFAELRERRPEEIIRHAVKGMLPQNRIGDRMITRLYVYAGSEHPYEDKLKSKNAKGKSTG